MGRGRGAVVDLTQNTCGKGVYFCGLVREDGFKVWTHTTMLAGHYRTTDITGLVCTLAKLTNSKR